jgi:hypothetical protein
MGILSPLTGRTGLYLKRPLQLAWAWNMQLDAVLDLQVQAQA